MRRDAGVEALCRRLEHADERAQEAARLRSLRADRSPAGSPSACARIQHGERGEQGRRAAGCGMSVMQTQTIAVHARRTAAPRTASARMRRVRRCCRGRSSAAPRSGSLSSVRDALDSPASSASVGDGDEPSRSCHVVRRGVGDLERAAFGQVRRRLDAQPAASILAIGRMQHRRDERCSAPGAARRARSRVASKRSRPRGR